jgi:curli biogenesis system outer membrane secretion channel CsgG
MFRHHRFSGLTRAAAGLACLLAVSGCVSSKITGSGGADMQSARADAYDGPKARVAVAAFEDKVGGGHYNRSYGRGMKDMLVTSLFQTNRYVVLEREQMRAIESERRLRGSKGQVEDADVLIAAAVTGFDPGSAGGKGGIGGIGGVLKSVTGSFAQAHVAIDLRVIDVDTGRVIAATSVEGKASGFGGGVSGGAGKLGGGLSGFANSPMETAIRDMIKTATDYVVQQTPRNYYRHKR